MLTEVVLAAAALVVPLPRHVVGAAPIGSPCPTPLRPQPTAWRVEGHEQLNGMAGTISQALKTVQVQVPGASGDIFGFRAGADYGLVYARDSATIAPAAQFMYDLPYLTRPVEEFLHLQFDGEPDDPEDGLWLKPAQPGAISGVIGGDEQVAMKMLVTSDEKTSIIHMAYSGFRAGAGPDWLLDLEAGQPRIQREDEVVDW